MKKVIKAICCILAAVILVGAHSLDDNEDAKD